MLMNIRTILTLAASKLVIRACRLFKRGGTSLAGKIALKIHPGILKILSSGYRVIMVTGTNGKTTTARIVGRILEEGGITYIANRSGANLLSGIATMFIEAAPFGGSPETKTAVIEVDEAAFRLAADHIRPEVLIVTNFFRDQLDRFKESNAALKSVREGIRKTPETKLVLNADDSLCASLGKDAAEEDVGNAVGNAAGDVAEDVAGDVAGDVADSAAGNTGRSPGREIIYSGREVIYYGMNPGACDFPDQAADSEEAFCLYCQSKYEYTNRIYGHLGGFKCPVCGYERPVSQVTCTGVEELTSASSWIKLDLGGMSGLHDARINLPGLYNIYNALAAAACGIAFGVHPDAVLRALDSFINGFGRMETIKAGSKRIKMILVKNPTGLNQVLSLLSMEESSFQLVFAINDRLGDGTDISWLWDADFEMLQELTDRAACFYTSGTRAEDAALRLKYAGIHTDRIKVVNDYIELIDRALSGMSDGENFYILPSYTAMMELRKVLTEKFHLKEFWK